MTEAICAWCGKHLGTREWGEGITHGICTECSKKELNKGSANEKDKQAEERTAY